MSIESIDYDRYKALKLDLDEKGILTITLSNPGKRNAMNGTMNQELVHIFDDAWADDDVKVIVLTGDGGDFCSGADVSGMASGKKREGHPVYRISREGKRHFYSMLDCEKPIISKVRGVAYGAGVNLAMGADMVYAAEGARFCDSHVKVGLVAGDGGGAIWPFLIGFNKAKEFLMTGEPIYAEKAAELGLINHCLPDDELDAAVQAMAEKLIALPPLAVNYTKAAINSMLKSFMGTAFDTGMAYECASQLTQDHKEATQAFMEKREGKFVGR